MLYTAMPLLCLRISLDAVMKNPEVDYIQPDVKMEAFAQTLPTGVNRVDGDLTQLNPEMVLEL